MRSEKPRSCNILSAGSLSMRYARYVAVRQEERRSRPAAPLLRSNERGSHQSYCLPSSSLIIDQTSQPFSMIQLYVLSLLDLLLFLLPPVPPPPILCPLVPLVPPPPVPPPPPVSSTSSSS